MSSIFTRIINREIPGHFVHEDEHCVVIMTIQPIRTGHMLVIPRIEIDHWLDLPANIAAHLMTVGQKVGKALHKAFPSERVGLIIAGMEVPHTHLHVISIDSMQDFSFANLAIAPADALAQAASKIREAL